MKEKTGHFFVDKVLKASKDGVESAKEVIERKELSRKKLNKLKKRVRRSFLRPKETRKNVLFAIDEILEEREEEYRKESQRILAHQIDRGFMVPLVNDVGNENPTVNLNDGKLPLPEEEAETWKNDVRTEAVTDNKPEQFIPPTVVTAYEKLIEKNAENLAFIGFGPGDLDIARELNKALLIIEQERVKRENESSPVLRLRSLLQEFMNENQSSTEEIVNFITRTNRHKDIFKGKIEERLRKAQMPDSKVSKQKIIDDLIKGKIFTFIVDSMRDINDRQTSINLIYKLTGNTIADIRSSEQWEYGILTQYPTIIHGLYLSIYDKKETGKLDITLSVLNVEKKDHPAYVSFIKSILNELDHDLTLGITI